MRVAPTVTVTTLAALGVAGWLLFGGSGAEALSPTLPAKTIEKTAANQRQVEQQAREAFMAGHPVRVEYQSEDPDKPKVKEYWSRALRDDEIPRVHRQFRRLIAGADKTIADPTRGGRFDEVEAEYNLSKKLRLKAQCEAGERIVNEGNAFITKTPLRILQSDDEWHYFNMSFRTKPEGDVVVYMPIEYKRFPYVKDFRRRASDMREFVKNDAGYRWNSKSYEERKALVDAAVAGQKQFDAIEKRLRELEAMDRSKMSPEILAEYEAVATKATAARDAVSAVPRNYDPVTLEWRP